MNGKGHILMEHSWAYITKKIVDVHGGTIKRDTDNKGTMFTISFSAKEFRNDRKTS